MEFADTGVCVNQPIGVMIAEYSKPCSFPHRYICSPDKISSIFSRMTTMTTTFQSPENNSRSLTAAKPAPKKSVFFVMVMLFLVIVVLGTVFTFAYFKLYASDTASPSGVIFEEVKRGVFLHEVTDRGNVESAQNEDIRCQVESMSGVLIVWIIPEGTVVEEGEILVRLDSSNLEERLANQEITVSNSLAAQQQAEADVAVARLALNEYQEGTYHKEKKAIENRILKAEEDLSRAAETRGYTEKLLAQGYVTELQLKADKAREQQLQNDLDLAEREMNVLLEYTSKKMLEQYRAAIKTAEAQLLSTQLRHSIDNTRRNYLKTQVENCTIRAPKAGQVVYASPSGPFRRDSDIIKEGNTARERQVLIRLPDPKQMQVAGMVNEASVSLVKVGQPATITLGAMPGHVFTGTVKQVNDFPEPDGIMGSMSKEYKAIISMDDLDNLPPNLRSGIRPGLTAQIKIDVTDPNLEETPILVPVQTLFENSGKYYCITCDNGKWNKVEVEVGATNDKEVIIKSGLTEGMRVVQGAWGYIDRVLTEEERTGAKIFGVGGARQRRGGPGRGPGGPGGPNGPDGPGGMPSSGFGEPGGFGGPGGGRNADRSPDAMPTNGELRRGNEMRENTAPTADREQPGNSGFGIERSPSPGDRQPPGGIDMRELPGNRQPPADGGVRPGRSQNFSDNPPPLSPPAGAMTP